jgi:hypothetical protein
MDRLSTLPLKDTDQSSEEKDIMNQIFGDEDDQEDESPRESSGMSWKQLLYLSILFILLANPLFDGLLNHASVYCEDSQFTILFIKVLLFAVIAMGIKYLC